MTTKSQPIAQTKVEFSAGITAGQLPGVDGRTLAARRYRELVSGIASDLGGDLSIAKQAIVCRAASLITWAEQAEADFAKSGKLDVATYTTAINSLRRLLADIGLDRQAKDVPDLKDWLAAREQKSK